MYDKLFAERRCGVIVVIFPLAWSIGGPASNGNGGPAETKGYVKMVTGGGREVGIPAAFSSEIACREACRASCFAARWNIVLQIESRCRLIALSKMREENVRNHGPIGEFVDQSAPVFDLRTVVCQRLELRGSEQVAGESEGLAFKAIGQKGPLSIASKPCANVREAGL